MVLKHKYLKQLKWLKITKKDEYGNTKSGVEYKLCFAKMIRRYIPKFEPIENYDEKYILGIKDFINNYPRVFLIIKHQMNCTIFINFSQKNPLNKGLSK